MFHFTRRRVAPAGPREALPFVRWRAAGFAVSLILIVVAAGTLAVGGLNLGSDFSGGTVVEARATGTFDVATLRSDLAAAGIPDAKVQLSDEGRTALVRTGADAAGTTDAIRAALGRGAEVVDSARIGPKVSAELLRSGILSCLLAVGAIGLYVWLRFDARFALSAFLTTFHDTAMMIGFFAVTRLPFDLTSVAAVLLIAGYSINDTVVVFDRLREMLGRHRAAPLGEVIDISITSTLRRTLMTSGTTLMTSVSLMAFGGPVLFGFASAVTFGIALGTLSSIFVAAPLLMHLPGPLPGRGVPEAQALQDRP